jgi:hypothetical protein
MTKDAITILNNTITHIEQIQNMLDDFDNCLSQQIKNEKIVDTSELFTRDASIPEMYFNELRYQQLHVIYPNTLRSSLFLTAYGTFESSIDILSDYYFANNKLRISPKDLNDKGITRSEKYLTKLVDLNFPSDRDEWKSIKELADIRHCIIHANGIVSQYTKSDVINLLVKKYSGISIENDHLIIEKYLLGGVKIF